MRRIETIRAILKLRLSLVPRLIGLVVLGSLVTGGLVGAAVIRSSRHILRQEIFTSNLAAADLAAEFMRHYVESAQMGARELASRPSIVRAVIEGMPEQAEPELRQFLKFATRDDSASIYDTRGIGRASGVINWQNRSGSIVDRDWFQQVMATGQPYLGAPVISRGTSHPNVPYGVPILDKKGVVRGVLVVGIPLSTLSAAITDLRVSSAARASLLDLRRRGIIVAHVDRDRILKPVSGRNEAVRRLLAGQRGAMETRSSSGEEVLAVFAPVPGLPWGVLILEPSDVAFAPMDAMARKALALDGMTVLFVGALGGGLALRITRPLGRLRRAANRLAAGDLTHRVNFTQADEIGDLGRTFDHMASALVEKDAQLHAQAEALEQRVHERTADLLSANAALQQEITERRRAEEALAARTRQLEAVRATTHEISRELELTSLLDMIHRRAANLLGASGGVVFLWDEARQVLTPSAWHGLGEWMKATQRRLGEGVAGLVAQRREGLIVNDYRTSPYAYPGTLERTAIRAVAAEPLLYQGRLVGVITVHDERTGRVFIDQDRETLALFATHAAIGIENARLFTTTEERATELQTLREIDQAIVGRLGLPEVLEAVVAGAMRVLGNPFAQLTLWDEATQRLRVGAPLGAEADQARNQTYALGQGANGAVAQSRQPMILDDYQASSYALPEFPDVVATITVPVLFEDRLLGVLHSHSTTSGKRFTPEDLRRLQMLATQAAIAIENARLHEATVRQLTELRALHDMGQAITSSLTLDEQLKVLVERLSRAMGAQRVLVGLLDQGERDRFGRCLVYDVSQADPLLRHVTLSPDRYPEIQAAVRAGRPLVIPEVATEPLLAPVRAHLEGLALRSLVILPLIVRERPIGAISLGYVGHNRIVTEGEVRFLQSFATQAAIAIEKAQLYEAIRRHAAELERRVAERTTALAAANQQLQEASRHKSEFLANMSHELRTPLNSVIGFAELMQDQRVGALTEKQARYLGHIAHGGKHLLQLISDILDLSKVEAGKFVLQPEPLPVAATLEDILVIARGLANKKGQAIEVQIARELPPLQADPVRFKQILFNLLSNAIKFTPEQGRIILIARHVIGKRDHGAISDPRVSTADEYLEISVTDTGIGIRAEDLPRLFQDFVQLETTQAQKQEGTGLGLALTRRLVELHGGRIWAASEGEGRGSTFTVLLPFGGPGE